MLASIIPIWLYQVRKKKLRGVQWYRRKFRIDYHKLYLHYLPGDNPLTKRIYKNAPKKMFRWVSTFAAKDILGLISFHRIDLADIIDVRKGFSTDIFNEVIEHENGKFFQLFQLNLIGFNAIFFQLLC